MDFLNEITRIFYLIRKHPEMQAAVRMTNRSIRKIATVARALPEVTLHIPPHKTWPTDSVPRPYIQTALVQRGLGLGRRMADMGISMQELKHFFRLMPVSIGVVFCECDPEIVKERNHLRRTVKETAHEDRAYMVDNMLPAIEVAKEVLDGRRVPILTIDTEQPIEQARSQLVEFATRTSFNTAPVGLADQVEVLSPPPWWV